MALSLATVGQPFMAAAAFQAASPRLHSSTKSRLKRRLWSNPPCLFARANLVVLIRNGSVARDRGAAIHGCSRLSGGVSEIALLYQKPPEKAAVVKSTLPVRPREPGCSDTQ